MLPAAPAWQDDPTGTFPATGSRLNATLHNCQTACITAGAACTSFRYDPGQRKCQLRTNECPYVAASINGCGGANPGIPQPVFCSYTDYRNVPPQQPVSGLIYQCSSGAITYYRKDVPDPDGCEKPVDCTAAPCITV
jgi:hypothetical protein